MDDALLQIVKSLTTPDVKNEFEMLLDPADASVTVKGAGGEIKHALKPLAELYGTGVNAETFDLTSRDYAPLCMTFEERFAEGARLFSDFRDSHVASALDRLAINPETPPAGDPLVETLQLDLRLLLSLNNYSRRDVQRACRKIAKSVARHTREGGPRGYLTFIRQALHH
jgi:hypothetical protein